MEPGNGRVGVQQLAFGEVADQAEVGGEEVVGGQRAQRSPADFVEDAVVDFAGELADHEELKVDGAAVAIAMAYLRDPGADDSRNAEFLVELAREGLLGGFAGFNLAAGKFPLQAHGLVRPALADEHFRHGVRGGGFAQNESRNDQPERLTVCVAVPVQLANPFFHAGVYLSSIGPHTRRDAYPAYLDAWDAAFGRKLRPLRLGSAGSTAVGTLHAVQLGI